MTCPTYQPQIRALLKAHPDGLSTLEIAARVSRNDNAVFKVLKRMPDVYIDRWGNKNHQYAAIWCAVRVPDDCPHPLRGKTAPAPVVETIWR